MIYNIVINLIKIPASDWLKRGRYISQSTPICLDHMTDHVEIHDQHHIYLNVILACDFAHGTWNSIPETTRVIGPLKSFRHQMKTMLFNYNVLRMFRWFPCFPHQ